MFRRVKKRSNFKINITKSCFHIVLALRLFEKKFTNQKHVGYSVPERMTQKSYNIIERIFRF